MRWKAPAASAGHPSDLAAVSRRFEAYAQSMAQDVDEELKADAISTIVEFVGDEASVKVIDVLLNCVNMASVPRLQEKVGHAISKLCVKFSPVRHSPQTMQ